MTRFTAIWASANASLGFSLKPRLGPRANMSSLSPMQGCDPWVAGSKSDQQLRHERRVRRKAGQARQAPKDKKLKLIILCWETLSSSLVGNIQGNTGNMGTSGSLAPSKPLDSHWMQGENCQLKHFLTNQSGYARCVACLHFCLFICLPLVLCGPSTTTVILPIHPAHALSISSIPSLLQGWILWSKGSRWWFQPSWKLWSHWGSLCLMPYMDACIYIYIYLYIYIYM